MGIAFNVLCCAVCEGSDVAHAYPPLAFFSKLEVWDLLGGEGQLGELIHTPSMDGHVSMAVGAELRHTLQSDNGTV